jgi:hypothetical protein
MDRIRDSLELAAPLRQMTQKDAAAELWLRKLRKRPGTIAEPIRMPRDIGKTLRSLQPKFCLSQSTRAP